MTERFDEFLIKVEELDNEYFEEYLPNRESDVAKKIIQKATDLKKEYEDIESEYEALTGKKFFEDNVEED